MAIDLSKPPAWLASSHEEQQMLREVQGNIPKGLGRPETTNIVFKLDPTRAQASRRALRKIVKEAKDAGIARWDPQFGLGAALVAEPPATPGAVNVGSDFILRKLEQDVRDSKRREQLLATELLVTGEEKREIAGALVVGRCEDGTRATMSDGVRSANPPNAFNDAGEGAAVARSRRTSARSTRETTARSGPPSAGHIMARRGISFGGHRAAGASVGFARQRERRRIGRGPRATMPRVARSSSAQLMRQA